MSVLFPLQTSSCTSAITHFVLPRGLTRSHFAIQETECRGREDLYWLLRNTQLDTPTNHSQVYFTTNKIPVPDSALSVATTPTTDTTIMATLSLPQTQPLQRIPNLRESYILKPFEFRDAQEHKPK
jgi:hypothetical protein